MKSLPNLKLTETQSAVSLLKECLKTMPQGGFDFDTIRARNKIADVLDKVTEGGAIELEDALYEQAVIAVKSTRWAVTEKHLIKFGELFGL